MTALTGLICGVTMFMQLQVVEQEYDGTYNHLLVAQRIPAKECPESEHVVNWHVKISQTGTEKLGEVGDSILVNADAECFSASAIDERETSFWAPYRVWLCNSTRLEKIR